MNRITQVATPGSLQSGGTKVRHPSVAAVLVPGRATSSNDTEKEKENHQVCTRCVMDTTDADIRFDEHGVCSHCHSYDRRAAVELLPPAEAEAALGRVVEQIRRDGQGKTYDCIIGVSGGVDSTTVALTVKRLGLRPLAVHLDNGWNAELAVRNIERCLKKLDIDLYTHVINWEEFRDLQLSLIRASIANIELVTDHAIMALLFQTAAKMNVGYIISGGNITTEAVMPRNWMYDSRDLRLIRSVHGLFGSGPLSTYPCCTLARYAYYIFALRIKYVPILNYIGYNKRQAKQTIIDELGWKDYGGKHYESIFTRFFQAYILPRKFGIDKRRPHLSTLVLSRQMTRSEALLELQKDLCPPDLLSDDLTFFLKKMGLSGAEFEVIMRSPVKTFRAYPSNGWLFARYDSWAFRFVKRMVRPSNLT